MAVRCWGHFDTGIISLHAYYTGTDHITAIREISKGSIDNVCVLVDGDAGYYAGKGIALYPQNPYLPLSQYNLGYPSIDYTSNIKTLFGSEIQYVDVIDIACGSSFAVEYSVFNT